MKNKYTTIGIVIATIILAGVAIFTAMRLYQTREEAVAPNVPSSRPAAQEATPSPAPLCSLSFTLATPTPSPSPSPSPSPVPQCNSVCTTTSQCPTGMTCSTGFCRNTQCLTETDCVCATSTPSPSPSPTPSPSPSPTATVTASPNPLCNGSCTANDECPSGMMCYITSGSTGNCRNTQCLSETDCTCAVVTSTPLLAEVPTTEPTLPVVGTSWPTIVGTAFGILVILGSLLLAL